MILMRSTKMFCFILTFLVVDLMGALSIIDPMAQIIQERIIGGSEGKIEDHPYLLSLQVNKLHVCSAIIIAERSAITSARCVERHSLSTLTVRAGSTHWATGGQIAEVVQIFRHPLFDTLLLTYDIAVIHLKSDLEFSEKIRAAALPIVNEEIEDGAVCNITGWGVLKAEGSFEGNFSKVFHAVKVRKMSDADCMDIYGSVAITESVDCYSAPSGKGPCDGDGGSAVVGDGTVFGVLSWVDRCAQEKFPVVYTKISHPEVHSHIMAHILPKPEEINIRRT